MKLVSFFSSPSYKLLGFISFSLLMISFIVSNQDAPEAALVSENSVVETPVLAEPVIGQVAMFAGNFEPRGWAFCDGRLLSIAQNSALFSILGTTYGGDGRTTFALPDLRGRVPVHAGQGPGLSNVRLGQKGGGERVSIGKMDKSIKGGGTTTTRAYQSINYIIALQGIFPSRN